MLAQNFSRWLQARNIHYAWVVMAVAFLTAVSTAGAVGIPGALIRPLTNEFGWDTAQISSALAIRLLLFGLMAPFSAALIERYGLQRVILSAITMILVGILTALVMQQVWHLVVAWGFIIGIGSGMTAIVMGAIVSTRWFVKRRGLVLGFLTASNATGQLVFLPMVAWMVDHYGWRQALMPSVIALLVTALLVLLFMVDRPSDIGLTAFGEEPGTVAPARAPVTQNAFARAFTALFEVSGSGPFWVLFGTFFICGLSTAGIIQTHFIPLCIDYGMTAVVAASVLAMMGMFDFVGTIASGWLSDRYDNRVLLFFYYGLRGLALLYLPFADFSFWGLAFFAMFYGLDWIATVPPTVRLAAQNFGREKAGIIFGWIFAGHQIGAAVAAYGAGISRTILQSYAPAYTVAAIACIVAAFLIWLLRTPEKVTGRPPAAAVPAK